jgi:hypothetical protein
MDERAKKRAEARARAGVSTRGVEVEPAIDPRTATVNAAGEATTAMIEDLIEKAGGSVLALSAILEGIMLNVAWHLYANAPDVTGVEFKRTFAKLAGDSADEVVAFTTEKPADTESAG